MSEHDDLSIHRRGFLQTSAIAGTAAIAVGTNLTSKADDAVAEDRSEPVPTRVLGRTGEKVSMLSYGTFRSESLNRLLRFTYANGVRYYDTADDYGTEPGIAQWMETDAEIRKSIFLVSKEHPRSPRELLTKIDQRLATLKTDSIDLYLIHGIGAGYPADSIEWPKSKEMKETVEALKKSGKVKFVGFSCHDARRAEFLEAAA